MNSNSRESRRPLPPSEPPQREVPTVPAGPRSSGKGAGSLADLYREVAQHQEDRSVQEDQDRRALQEECDQGAGYVRSAIQLIHWLERDPFAGYAEERMAMKGKKEAFPKIREMIDENYENGHAQAYRYIKRLLNDPFLSRAKIVFSPEVGVFPESSQRSWNDARWRAKLVLRTLMTHSPEILAYIKKLKERSSLGADEEWDEALQRHESTLLPLAEAAKMYEGADLKDENVGKNAELATAEENRMKLFPHAYKFLRDIEKYLRILSKNFALDASSSSSEE